MRRLLSALPFLALLACTEPEPIISGQFGGRLMELSANASSARFRLPCGQIKTAALRTDGKGIAYVAGTMTFEGAGTEPVPVNIEVHTVHTFYLQVVIHFPGSSEEFELLRNARGDFSGIGCIA